MKYCPTIKNKEDSHILIWKGMQAKLLIEKLGAKQCLVCYFLNKKRRIRMYIHTCLYLHSRNGQTFPVKGQTVNIFGFVGHTISAFAA